jgi:hypothetical protein
VSESLIPISDEQAKLGQDILKALRGIGSFVEKALGSTPEDLIAYLGGDWLRFRRAENLVKLFEKTRQRLIDWNIQNPIPASLSVALPILQGAADEDREELADLWARLLANAMDPNLNTVRQLFIEAVKRMDPLDTVVLRYTHEKKIEIVIAGGRQLEAGTIGCDHIGRAIDRRYDEVELSILHLRDLGFFEEHRSEDDDANGDLHLSWWVTAACREFLRACYPEVKGSRAERKRDETP